MKFYSVQNSSIEMAGVCELDGANDGDYYCSLDLPTQEKALRELREDPKEREGRVQTFRTLLGQQPSFKCPTGEWLSS